LMIPIFALMSTAFVSMYFPKRYGIKRSKTEKKDSETKPQ
jgi:hypothetical protein